jgi:ribosomal protein S18 acetylase RimI-like enzyme
VNGKDITNKPKIRSYDEGDLAACSDIFISNVPKFFLKEELTEYQDYLRKYAQGSYWVIADKNDVFAAGGIHVKENGIGSLCFGMVRSDLHKRGFGSRMISYRILKLLENPSVKKIRLDTSQHTPKFFQKFGFIITGIVENFYGAGLHRHDMELTLPDDAAALQSLKKLLADSAA